MPLPGWQGHGALLAPPLLLWASTLNVRTLLPMLLLAASAIALAATASATAQNENIVSVTPPSPASLGLYNFTVSWELLFNNTTLSTDVSDSAVYFDTVTHGPAPSDYTLYAARADGASSDGANFTANITAPAAPATL